MTRFLDDFSIIDTSLNNHQNYWRKPHEKTTKVCLIIGNFDLIIKHAGICHSVMRINMNVFVVFMYFWSVPLIFQPTIITTFFDNKVQSQIWVSDWGRSVCIWSLPSASSLKSSKHNASMHFKSFSFTPPYDAVFVINDCSKQNKMTSYLILQVCLAREMQL